MKNFRRIISMLLASCIIFTMIAGFSTLNHTVDAKEKNLKTLKLNLLSGNTYLYLHDSQEFSYDYDKSLFTVHVSENDSNLCITVSKKEGAKLSIKDKVKVYIPDSLPFDHVEIKNNLAGIVLCEMNKPITINSDHGSVILPLPKNYTNTLKITAKSSAVILRANKNTGINFALTTKESGIALPKSFKNYIPTTTKYSYQYGDGAAHITANVTYCSFVVKFK